MSERHIQNTRYAHTRSRAHTFHYPNPFSNQQVEIFFHYYRHHPSTLCDITNGVSNNSVVLYIPVDPSSFHCLLKRNYNRTQTIAPRHFILNATYPMFQRLLTPLYSNPFPTITPSSSPVIRRVY